MSTVQIMSLVVIRTLYHTITWPSAFFSPSFLSSELSQLSVLTKNIMYIASWIAELVVTDCL